MKTENKNIKELDFDKIEYINLDGLECSYEYLFVACHCLFRATKAEKISERIRTYITNVIREEIKYDKLHIRDPKYKKVVEYFWPEEYCREQKKIEESNKYKEKLSKCQDLLQECMARLAELGETDE